MHIYTYKVLNEGAHGNKSGTISPLREGDCDLSEGLKPHWAIRILTEKQKPCWEYENSIAKIKLVGTIAPLFPRIPSLPLLSA